MRFLSRLAIYAIESRVLRRPDRSAISTARACPRRNCPLPQRLRRHAERPGHAYDMGCRVSAATDRHRLSRSDHFRPPRPTLRAVPHAERIAEYTVCRGGVGAMKSGAKATGKTGHWLAAPPLPDPMQVVAEASLPASV